MYRDYLKMRSLEVFCCIAENLSVSNILKAYVYVVVVMAWGIASNESLVLMYLCFE